MPWSLISGIVALTDTPYPSFSPLSTAASQSRVQGAPGPSWRRRAHRPIGSRHRVPVPRSGSGAWIDDQAQRCREEDVEHCAIYYRTDHGDQHDVIIVCHPNGHTGSASHQIKGHFLPGIERPGLEVCVNLSAIHNALRQGGYSITSNRKTTKVIQKVSRADRYGVGLHGGTCWLRIVRMLRWNRRALLARHDDQCRGDRCTKQPECVLTVHKLAYSTAPPDPVKRTAPVTPAPEPAPWQAGVELPRFRGHIDSEHVRRD